MSLNICAQSFDLYGNNLKLLAERLRKNWMQKLSNSEQTDDSLTSLTWLYDANPISMNFESTANYEAQDISINSPLHENFSKYSLSCDPPYAGSLLDPQVRMDYRTKWTGKPPFSYATLICLAMRELGKPKVTLSDIYGWIMNNFAYYRHTDSSWQNSVRHNLSLNKCFEKVPRDKGERGKGGFWRVNPRHIDWLEANLAKCRRAAPPPGPPPPIPRSMLLQQRKIQQQSQYQQAFLPRNLILSPPSVPMNNSGTNHASFTANICVPELSPDSMKNHQISALSPSSNSSLSSSPLSFASVGSPANFQSTKISVTSSHTTYQNSVHTILMNHSVVSEMNSSSTLPPLSISGNVSQSCVTQTVAGHRRKSPLFKNSQMGMAHNVLFESDDGLSDEDTSVTWGETTHFMNKSPNIPSKSNHCDLNHNMSSQHSDWNKRSRYMNPNVNSINFKNAQSQSLSRNDNSNNNNNSNNNADQQSPCKIRSKSSLDKSNITNRGTVIERLKRSKSKQNVKSSGSNEPKVLPTRVLPPRQRYSRWALPRPNPITSNNGSQNPIDESETCTSIKLETSASRKSKKQDNDKRIAWNSNDTLGKCGELSPLLNCIENDNGNHSDDNNINMNCDKDSGYLWSSLNKADSNMTDVLTNHTYIQMKRTNSPDNHPSSCGSCKDYSLPNYNTYYLGDDNIHMINTNSNIKRETASLSACSSSSSASTFSYHSDVPNGRHSSNSMDPFHSSSGVVTHVCKPSPFNDDSGVMLESEFIPCDSLQQQQQGQSLSATLTCDNDLTNKSSEEDKTVLPNWASLFLSDDDTSDLDCLFNDNNNNNNINNKRNNESFNLFTNASYESGIHSTSTLHSSPTSLSPPLSQPSSCSLTTSSFLFKTDKSDAETFVNDSKLPTDSSNIHSSNNNSNNPILEELGLDTANLDFDSLDELVDGNGAIPLDIDFSLTTSFNNDTFLDSNDSLSHDWNTSMNSNHTNISSSSTSNGSNKNNNNEIACNTLLYDKIKHENQPQWPENLEVENDVLPLQQNASNDSQWLNASFPFNSSSGLTMFLSETTPVHIFEGNF
uniref:Fork-head domain-containing protein n=1 Tax=Trichobilharzia regenti TaxID=157069 RepID=A0AA85JWJ2_TRIRE|nr:unnamed protein product [Trichobilharzia regenti]